MELAPLLTASQCAGVICYFPNRNRLVDGSDLFKSLKYAFFCPCRSFTTVDFWLIKLMGVTMGETAADYLAVNLGLGLTVTSLIMAGLLAIGIAIQFGQKRYIPYVYWLAVVLIIIVGTLVTDNLVDNFGVSLQATTVAFSIALIATFIIWRAKEGTLSIHSISTDRREVFYWLPILFTFALGTSVGDLIAEVFGLGYVMTGVLFGLIIAAIAFAYCVLRLDAILAFWLAYILTRPLGASLGDYLSQPSEYGGLGLGTIYTSLLFLGVILAIVVFMTARFQPEVATDGKRAV